MLGGFVFGLRTACCVETGSLLFSKTSALRSDAQFAGPCRASLLRHTASGGSRAYSCSDICHGACLSRRRNTAHRKILCKNYMPREVNTTTMIQATLLVYLLHFFSIGFFFIISYTWKYCICVYFKLLISPDGSLWLICTLFCLLYLVFRLHSTTWYRLFYFCPLQLIPM